MRDVLKKLDIALESWKPHIPAGEVISGDMPGDSVRIGEEHLQKAGIIFPKLLPLLRQSLEENGGRAVLSVFGGSGVGKSEIASLLSCYLREIGIGAYTLSGDNYPRRIPQYNDAERIRIFRVNGLKGLLEKRLYSREVRADLEKLWTKESDADPAEIAERPWLSVYQRAGREALAGYLGQDAEQDFGELKKIVEEFREGAERIWLKRMGRTEDERWYEEVDFREIHVLVIEWTHGGSGRFGKVDCPILLASTPAETREHRRARARDKGTDSAFTTMVLEIEQQLIEAGAADAKIIVSKGGDLINLENYQKAMEAGR